MMLALNEERKKGAMSFYWHLQCHDSITLSCERAEIDKIAAFGLNLDNWHPEVRLAGGRLRIPSDCQIGKNLKELKEWTKA